MKLLIHMALCGLFAVLALTGTATAKSSSADPFTGRAIPRLSTTDGAPIELAAQPGSEADKLARQLMAREIARAHAEGTDPLVLVGMGRLNDTDELLFVQIQSYGECGSAGFNTVSFRYEGDQWIRIMDTVRGTVRIAQSPSRHARPDSEWQSAGVGRGEISGMALAPVRATGGRRLRHLPVGDLPVPADYSAHWPQYHVEIGTGDRSRVQGAGRSFAAHLTRRSAQVVGSRTERESWRGSPIAGPAFLYRPG